MSVQQKNVSRYRLGIAAAVAAGLLVSGAPALAQSAGNLTVLSLGGSYQEAQSKFWFKPFAQASGVNLTEAAGYNFAKLKVMIESGNVEADVVDISADTADNLGHAGLLEKIDWSKIPADCKAGIPAAAKRDYAFPTIQWAMVMAYNTKTFPEGKAPKTWADFWNVSAFPGKRASIGATRPPVEQAALAINGDLAKLYPIDLDAAFAKIKSLGSAMVFADGYAQVAQYLADGEADMVVIPNGRVAPLVAAGKPVAINWNQHLTFPNFFAIPKGAPNKDNAMKFLAFVCKPEVMAAIAPATNYGPINMDAYTFITPQVAALLPGNPKTASMGREADAAWLAKFRGDIAKGWSKMAIR
ncbi:ABC transporter substrate-binding protein [Azorhizobium oxalatiphilum]|uniref:ABC transporter substrate-binding protein n=1 Tax=Azorhizobium oxalatiphilum TaxID=980631 RepID=A0A917BQ90_9HYPH|nr:ABC transporter substrate-binding protein [Azorhizobium oxalatiphilum]GGF54709.1 ABC transporter substrate-binding protein [Azorhizobium oxalatiphilum]